METKEPCSNCGATQYYGFKVVYTKEGRFQTCSNCDKISCNIPDVYFDSSKGANQIDRNLVDRKTGKPIPFSSKREKAAVLKKLNLGEAGDKIHGGRIAHDKSASKQWNKVTGKL